MTRLSQSGMIFAARIAGAGLMFLVQAAIARAWGGPGLADYLLLISAVNIAAMLMPLGFQTIGSYFAVEYRTLGRREDLRRFLVRAHGQVLLTAACLGVLALIAGPVAGWLPGTMMQLMLPGFILSVAMGSVFINGAVLVGLKRPVTGFMADGLGRPVVVLAGFAIAIMLTDSVAQGLLRMTWAMAAGYSFVAVLCLLATVRAVRGVDATGLQPVPDEPRRWWRFAVPWAIIAIATEFLFDLQMLLLAGLMEKPDLAVFGVCARIFALAAFGVTAVQMVLMPGLMEADAQRDVASFRRRLGDANLAATAAAMALTLAALAGGPLLLSLFGAGFEAGRWPLVILCAALVVRSFFGPAELVLSLNNRPWAAMPAIAAGLATLLAANLWLVPALGVTGAALAALVSISVWSVARWRMARSVSGLDVSLLARFLAEPTAVVK